MRGGGDHRQSSGSSVRACQHRLRHGQHADVLHLGGAHDVVERAEREAEAAADADRVAATTAAPTASRGAALGGLQRTSRTWRSEDRRCRRERARRRSWAIGERGRPVGRLVWMRASPRTAPEARRSETELSARCADAGGRHARGLDGPEEGVEGQVEAIGAGPERLGCGAEHAAELLRRSASAPGQQGPRRARPPAAGRAARGVRDAVEAPRSSCR